MAHMSDESRIHSHEQLGYPVEGQLVWGLRGSDLEQEQQKHVPEDSWDD